MDAVDRESEIVQLSALYGTPVRQRCVLYVSDATIQWWASEKYRQRAGEVVLFIRLQTGDLLLHTKGFYPAGVFRVPSGGIKTGEGLCDAVRREALEETGLEVAIERFLAVIEIEFRCQELIIPYPSYLFLLRAVGGVLKTMDKDERITAFTTVPMLDLFSVAERLDNLPPDWHDWGQFRALPHRVAAELLQAMRFDGREAV